jgi:hypothetical protein
VMLTMQQITMLGRLMAELGAEDHELVAYHVETNASRIVVKGKDRNDLYYMWDTYNKLWKQL